MVSWTHLSPYPKRHLDGFSRFCTAHCRAPILYNGPPLPLKIAPSRGEICTPSNTCFWAHPSPQLKQHLDRFSHFCSVGDCDRRTDRQTDRPCYSVSNNRSRLRNMWLNNVMVTPTIAYINFFPNPSGSLIPRVK